MGGGGEMKAILWWLSMWTKPYGEWTIVSSFLFALPFMIIIAVLCQLYCEGRD
jgi:hypothetical protein